MKRFTNVYMALDSTTKRNRKVAALANYFEKAPPADAAWALHLLCGRRLMRALPTRRLRQWAAEEADLPVWLVDECYDNVGDLSETLSLIVPDAGPGTDAALADVIEQWLLPLGTFEPAAQRASLVAFWHELDRPQRFLFHKLISGAFRVGVAQRMVVQALSETTGVPPAVLAHRLMGSWRPTPADYAQLIDPRGNDVSQSQPYPFFLASPLEGRPEDLGDVNEWQVEWKWDGVRAQLIRRDGQVFLWSRGEEMVNEQFPEIVAAARDFPTDAVLDGELLAWEKGRPLAFHFLQRRLNRKRVAPVLFHDVPVVFMAYDLLERDGVDLRNQSLRERCASLATLLASCRDPAMQRSPVLPCETWDDVTRHRDAAARAMTEGVMLKSVDAAYGVGRIKGPWWKLKRDPYSIDVVLTAAQRGHGKRATLFSDLTFAVWDRHQLVTIAKAYSGLTESEIRDVDRFVRRNTTERRGPIHFVKPELVFELAFEGVQPSTRHKSGLALRFPRMARQRTDKTPGDADTLENVRALLAATETDG
jgi:DNA ligase-1